MAVSGYFGRTNLFMTKVELEFPDEIYSNKPFPLKITLINERKFMPVFLIRILVADESILFPFVDCGAKMQKYITYTFSKRGYNNIADIYISSVFPFNFFVRNRVLKIDVTTIVFPEPKPCELSWFFDKDYTTDGDRVSNKSGYGLDILSLRNYIHGDPLKYISWKATAKTDTLKTKEFSSKSAKPVIIDYDKIKINSVEEKTSCIAYYILLLLRNNTPVGLKISDKLYKPELSYSNKLKMMGELSLL